MREQGRAKGITYLYTYTGPDAIKPLNCKIGQMAHEHLIALLGLLLLLVLCSQVAQHFYSRYYIRKEVLNLLRMHSQHGDGTSLTRGIPTDIIFNLLCKRLARRGSVSRFFLRGRLTVERVEEACHELLWNPETGVHAYRLNETNHWWAERDLPSSADGQGTGRENTPSFLNNTGPTLGPTGSSEKPTPTANNLDSYPHQHSGVGGPPNQGGRSDPSQFWMREPSRLPGNVRAHNTPHSTAGSLPISTFGQVCTQAVRLPVSPPCLATHL